MTGVCWRPSAGQVTRTSRFLPRGVGTLLLCNTHQGEHTMTKQLFANFLREESGQDLIEYALIAALIALVAIGAMQTLGSQISNQFNTVGSSL